MKRFFFCTSLILSVSAVGLSQTSVDILKLGYTQSLSVPSGNTQSDVYGNLLIPVPMGEKLVIISGVNQNYVTTTRNDTDIILSQSTIPLGFQAELGDKYSVTAIYLHRFTQVIKPWHGVQYQPGVFAMITRKVSENFKYNVGLYYNADNSGPFYAFVLGLNWKPTEKLQIKGIMPIDMKVLYRVNKSMRIGISYAGKYGTFMASPNYIVLTRNEFALFLEYAVVKNIFVQVGPSLSLGNTNKFFAKGDEVNASIDGFHLNDSRNLLDIYELNNALFFDVKLIYRIFRD